MHFSANTWFSFIFFSFYLIGSFSSIRGQKVDILCKISYDEDTVCKICCLRNVLEFVSKYGRHRKMSIAIQ